MSNRALPSPPSSPVHSTTLRRGNALIPGTYYTLELVGGKGHPAAISGFTYLATDFVDKDSGRLVIDSSSGEHYFTDESDIYQV